jgi:acetylornithine deacetylase/succinyl-diaminopimelate desuccinylase-like protein
MDVEEVLSQLIRIPSVNPPGNETPVARYLQQLFSQAGITGEVVESREGRGSFICQIGEGPKSLLFLSHTDVVPVGEGWDFDPFSGEIKDGMVLGRGALDCKGLTAAQAWAALQLSRKALRGRLIFAATADEEAGGKWGIGYLMENSPEKLKADFVINEGAEQPVWVNGNLIYFIQVGEKGAAWLRLRSRGVSAHGSVPTLGDNAVVHMARAVSILGEYQAPIHLIPQVRQLLQALARAKGFERRVTARGLDGFLDGFEEKGFREYLRAIVRLTISPNAINGGTKTNIVPDRCDADVDIRVLPGQDLEFVRRELRRLIGDDIEIEVPHYQPPTFSGTGLPFYWLIAQTIGEVMGKGQVLPCVSSGGTDSRFLREAGIPSYGISIMAPDHDPRLRETVHGRNERIDVESLRLKARFLLRLAEAYLGS